MNTLHTICFALVLVFAAACGNAPGTSGSTSSSSSGSGGMSNPCPDGYTMCAPTDPDAGEVTLTCERLDINPDNCGACGNVCPKNSQHVQGTCVNGGCVEVPCMPITCADSDTGSPRCGPTEDKCGGMLDCGSCDGGTCGSEQAGYCGVMCYMTCAEALNAGYPVCASAGAGPVGAYSELQTCGSTCFNECTWLFNQHSGPPGVTPECAACLNLKCKNEVAACKAD